MNTTLPFQLRNLVRRQMVQMKFIYKDHSTACIYYVCSQICASEVFLEFFLYCSSIPSIFLSSASIMSVAKLQFKFIVVFYDTILIVVHLNFEFQFRQFACVLFLTNTKECYLKNTSNNLIFQGQEDNACSPY